MDRSMDADKTPKTADDEAPEWRGGNRPDQEAEARSGKEGWGNQQGGEEAEPMAEPAEESKASDSEE